MARIPAEVYDVIVAAARLTPEQVLAAQKSYRNNGENLARSFTKVVGAVEDKNAFSAMRVVVDGVVDTATWDTTNDPDDTEGVKRLALFALASVMGHKHASPRDTVPLLRCWTDVVKEPEYAR